MSYRNGFVIEYTHQGSRISCYKCIYCNKDNSCGKTGAYVPDDANERWKKCKYFELDLNWDTDELRAKAARIRAMAQGKKSKKKANAGSKPKGKKQQPVAGVKKNAKTKKGSKGLNVAQLYGHKVISPKYGSGKVVGVDGKWVTVVFFEGPRRMRFKADVAKQNDSLRFL